MTDQAQHCQCSCGATKFTVKREPLFRAICHCTICQEFNEADFGDIAIYRAKDVEMPADGLVDYKSYASPPIVKRGKCTACGKPAVEYMKAPGMPKLVFVPSENVAGGVPVEPAMHVFYNRRKADAQDGLPKHSGYWKSQFAFMKRLFAAK